MRHLVIGTLAAAGLFGLLNACNNLTPTVAACPAAIQTQEKTSSLPYAYIPANCNIKLSGASKTITIKAVQFVHQFSTVSTNWPGGPVSSSNNDYVVTFTAPGTYTYICAQHSEMTGTIIVEN